MTYKILYDKPAVKFLRKQSQDKREWIMNAIHKLPNAGDIKPLEDILTNTVSELEVSA